MNGVAFLAALAAWFLAVNVGHAQLHPLHAIGFAVIVFVMVRGALRSAVRKSGL